MTANVSPQTSYKKLHFKFQHLTAVIIVLAITIILVVPPRGSDPGTIAREIENLGLGQAVVVDMPEAASIPPPGDPCFDWSPQVTRHTLQNLVAQPNGDFFIAFDLKNPIYVRIAKDVVTIVQAVGYSNGGIPLFDVSAPLDASYMIKFITKAGISQRANEGPSALTLIKKLLDRSDTIRSQPIGDIDTYLNVPDSCR